MLDTRLGQIEEHLSGLNIKWQNTDATLRNQNLRIAAVKSLYDKVERLEAEQHTLNETNQKLNETVIDLQCRSM